MSDTNTIITTIIIGLVLIVIAIILLAGKGSFLIAGYNTMSEIERAKYDDVALSRFMGKIMLPIGILCPVITIAGIYKVTWLVVLLIAVTVGLVFFAIIYCNTGNRFRK